MADSPISGMPPATALDGTELLHLSQAVTDVQETLATVLVFFGLITKKLSADLTNATTTFAKVTNLDQAVPVGTWKFEYHVRYQSDTTTTGIKFAVNFTGTVTSFVAMSLGQGITRDQSLITSGAVQGGAARAISATVALVQTAGVDTINADMLEIIVGHMVVTVAGNIELYHASEVATTTTIKQDSGLILTRMG